MTTLNTGNATTVREDPVPATKQSAASAPS